MRTFTRMAILFLALAAGAQNSRVWSAKLPDKQHSGMTVTAANGEILISADDVGVIFNFPPSAITKIVYSSESYRRSTKAYNYFDQKNAGNDMLAALAMSLTAPLGKSKKHLIEIRWRATADRESTVSLEFKRDDFTGFLDWLKQLSGQNWANLDDESRQAEDYINHHAASAFRVTLGDPYTGRSQEYYVLPIELSGKTNLYFFQGSVRSKSVSGIVPVNAEFSDNDCVDFPAVLYGDCRNSSCDMAAIVLPTITYRTITPVTAGDTKAAKSGDCDQLRRQRARAGNSGENP